jgi:hypothetical protein
MLFFVIERFRDGDAARVGDRFKQSGRMLPDGVTYRDSWIDPAGTRCFQIVETERPELLDAWIRCWDDLVEIEVVPVLPSSDFWAEARERERDSIARARLN